MKILEKPFYFIRHGETDWNKNQIVMGQKDIPLNEKGLKQARQAAFWLWDIELATIIASPLQRAYTTAKIIAEKTGKVITVIDELKECYWGCREGVMVDEGLAVQNWLVGNGHEGIEVVLDFDRRVI